MTDETKAFLEAWSRRRAQAEGDCGGQPEELAALALPDTPAWPLARKVQMPPGRGYETGALSLRMVGLVLEGFGRLGGAHCLHEAGGRVRMELALERLTLRGRYSLEVKPDPIIHLDTAGNLMELPPEACRAAGAEPEDNALDPQKEQWLDQAREQRTRLSQTPNGQQLLSLYNAHNEIYESVFRENEPLKPLWRANGATREMAADTAVAVSHDSVVNTAHKTYAGGITYNGNAFAQQLNVASACVWTDPDFDPERGPPPDSKYWAAAKAALSFGKGVSSTTQNSKDSAREMKPSEIHVTVQQYQGELPAVTDEEMQSVTAMGVGAGGAEAERNLGWLVIDEQGRRRLRYLYEATLKQKAEDAAIRGQPLHEGRCEAHLEGARAIIELAVEEGPSGARARALSAEVELPAFELELDDSQWAGEVGKVARQRLERMYFIRSLLHDSLVDRLQCALMEETARAYETALRAS